MLESNITEERVIMESLHFPHCTSALRRALGAFVLTLGLSAVSAPAPLLADTVVASWNIRNLGWGDSKNYHALAEVAKRFDLIAIQEVMSEDGIEELRTAVQQKTGVEWHVLNSHLVGRGRYKEIYSFLYRADKVEWVEGAVVYTDQRDAFEREPFSAVFETGDGYQFVLATAHLIYGEDVDRRRYEVKALADYREWLVESFPGLPVYLSGDFNLPPSDGAWDTVGITAHPLITSGATTLSTRDGQFANLYDNIWVPAETAVPIVDYGVTPFPAMLGMSHQDARDIVSDHIPVWMILDASEPPLSFPAWSNGPVAPINDPLQSHPTDVSNVIGNKSSSIYHVEGCPGFTKIAPRNQVNFASEAEAATAGYRRAGNCS